MEKREERGYRFIGDDGSFVLEDPHRTSTLYFPLANEAGLMSSITPLLGGDIKTGQNAFLLAPVSAEDLHCSRATRNFWVYVKGAGAWSATGHSARQMAQTFDDDEEQVVLEAGFLWHKVTRESRRMGLRSEIVSFVPANEDKVELMRVSISNVSGQTVEIVPTAAIPIYGRSADNIRDHRHVTSLLHRIRTLAHGVAVRPTLSFDERGHRLNETTYCVVGAEGEGAPPLGFFPTVEAFVGEGGSLDWPEAVVCNLQSTCGANAHVEGYEAIGALRFADARLEPGQMRRYLILMAILEDDSGAEALADAYSSQERVDALFEETTRYWQAKLDKLSFRTGDVTFDRWMRWVTLQPILRRIYGCSFLPHHDYGRGGRGWRDLWQDCLALLIMDPLEVRSLLLDNYAGVRIDGTNATIIGSRPGEFIADRNNISRVWMDHGTWPFLTTKLYVDQSGDVEFLLEEQVYFKDAQISRARDWDSEWEPAQGTRLMNPNGEEVVGTVLEHILVQHLTAFFNVGDHNVIALEGADWNDALDMAPERGESVAFSALYASSLQALGDLLLAFESKTGVREVALAAELMVLLDRLAEPVDYGSVQAKRDLLHAYFAACRHTLSGDRVQVSVEDLARDLTEKGRWLSAHIREHEWVRSGEGLGWFNGYYDNAGQRVEGDLASGVRMTLTGQVFTVMGGIATDEQVREIVRSADRYLKDPSVGGYRLNTDFGEVKLDLGRCFGFAFGHKENGAMFSHMAVMYAYALYARGFAREGHEVIRSIARHCCDFERSRIYPGIPEYINARGRGMYHYLTGSASWLLLALREQAFGVRGCLGDLLLEPKLLGEQFDEQGEAAVLTLFAGRRLNIVYRNPSRLDHGQYRVLAARLDGGEIVPRTDGRSHVIQRGEIEALDEQGIHLLEVDLG